MSSKKAKVEFKVGDLVFAKVRGFPHWPARISALADSKATRFHVFFYGTYETGVCKKEDICFFNEESETKFGQQTRKGFSEGLYEIKNTPDIAVEVVEPVNVRVEQASITEDTSAIGVLPDAKVSAKKGQKRKVEDSTTPIATPAKKRKVTEVKTVETPVSVEKLSRSGRKIKQKKFDIEEPKSATKKNRADKNEIFRGPSKFWVQIPSTGDVVEIDLNQDRPEKFDSKASEKNWQSSVVAKAQTLRNKILSGEFIPEEILQKSEKSSLVDDKTKASQVAIRQEKVRWLKLEQRLVEVDFLIRKSLHHLSPDMEKALELLDEFHKITIGSILIKKQPQVVETVRKLRKYVGPKNADANKFEHLTEKIRLRADSIYVKIQSAFAMPDDSELAESHFAEKIDFTKAVQDLEKKSSTKKVTNNSRRKTK